MLRQVSSRNQRSKGFRVKHVLQICVLVAVSIWLLYQVKHSHDKKKAFEERTSKVLKVEESQSQIFKFGRKDLPNTAETDSAAETHLEGEEKEEAEEVEQEVKQEESEDGEGREAGDDMIDEQDQEIADEEADHGEEEVVADKEGNDGLAEESDMLDNQEHDEGSSQEARERTFKGDDASSAVLEGTQTAESESENVNARNLDEEQLENLENKDTEAEITVNGSKRDASGVVGPKEGSKSDDAGVLEGNETVSSNSLTMNWTAVEKRESEVGFSKLEDGSNANSTSAESNNQIELQTVPATMTVSSSHKELQMKSAATIVSNTQMETQDNASVVDTETNGVTLQNETSIAGAVGDRNATVEMGSPVEDIYNSEKLAMEQVNKSTDILEESKESSTTATNENGYTAQGESNNSSHNAVTKEVTDARTNVLTLPNIQNDAKSGGGEAAE